MRNVQFFKQPLLLALLLFPFIAFTQVNQEWVRRHNGDFNSPDAAYAAAVDREGHLYVTGGSTASGRGLDYATLKYERDGERRWTKKYNGPANGNDEAVAIAVDSSGNIYVTGKSAGSGSNNDFATIKYDDDGDTKWVRRFNGLANGDDHANAITVDAEGNVYVTGQSTGIGTSGDFATIKYDKNGLLLWVALYNGPGNGMDEAVSVAVDHLGNVFVTGRSRGAGTGWDYAAMDYATIKYNSFGDELWVKRYNFANLPDVPSELAVDKAGNVYVTGSSSPGVDFDGNTAFDYATIKYDTDGNEQWTSRYDKNGGDRADALAVDEAGNVYVTGECGMLEEDPTNDFVTVKYNAAGQQQWAAIFLASWVEGRAADIALDYSDNLYVTGYNDEDYVTIKYSRTGIEKWIRKYDGPGNNVDAPHAMAVDEEGNVFITGESRISPIGIYTDYITIRYNADGDQKWVKIYNGVAEPNAGLEDKATAMAVDNNGRIYVTGGSTENGTGLDYTTIRYNSNGDHSWTKQYNGPGNGTDFANALTTDSSGNVYITGRSKGNGTHFDFATIKYDNDGNRKWLKRYNGPLNDFDEATAIAIDESENVYVAGKSKGIGTGMYDFAVIKYNKDGSTKWIRRYNGAGNGQDAAISIAADKDGNVYVTGVSTGSAGDLDYATVKYDANGNELWAARYDNGGYDEPLAMALDPSGNVYVTGRSSGSPFAEDYATVKYDTNGNVVWVARYSGTPLYAEIPVALALDASGNVYVTGSSSGTTTVKYNGDGTEQWVAKYAGASPETMAVDKEGNIYITGTRTGTGLGGDFITLKYNANGEEQWVQGYDHDHLDDKPAAIAIDANNNIYVTGQSSGNGTRYDYATIKYSQPAVPVTGKVITVQQKEVRSNFILSHFPNPVISTARINYELPFEGQVTIRLYDMQGKEVAKILDAVTKEGSYSMTFDASRLKAGNYYYRISLQKGNRSLEKTEKMTIVR